MSETASHCIFCGSDADSKEHVWADWLKEFIPRERTETTTYSAVVHPDRTDAKSYSQTGDPHSRRLQVVCKRCNTGWMSQLQQHTKSTLIPLVTGESASIDWYAQRRIAAWAAMAVMVSEFHEPERVAISQEDRTYLMLHRDAPTNWKIWLGHYERGEWAGHWLHNVLPVYLKERVPHFPIGEIPIPNTQTTTFVVGKLYIHAISSSVAEVTQRLRLVGTESDKLAVIWPNPTSTVEWPTPVLSDSDAHDIANAFFNRALSAWGQKPI